MTSDSIEKLPRDAFPSLLNEIPDVPEQLFVRGKLPAHTTKLLCVVGSRKYTSYGRDVCDYLIEGLQGYPLSIVSGLALGTDGNAHRAALKANLHTIAVPGSGLDDSVIYPASHRMLAKEILSHGGALLSEFEPTFQATQWSFPQRNRIMAGMSHATLIIEASEKSGTLITARLTSEYNRDLLVVPGSIFSGNAHGPHQFLKLGATPVTTPADILEALGIAEEQLDLFEQLRISPEEQVLLALLNEPKSRDEIIRESELSTSQVQILLAKMELAGIIHESSGLFRKI